MADDFHISVATASHCGPVRRANQDAWAHSPAAGVFVVCDGMGGAAGGEVASSLAAEAFLEQVSAIVVEQRNARVMSDAVSVANRRVHGRASHERALAGMGTTLVALAFGPERELLLAHVGDSRCYLWRQRTLTQLTVDHSLVAEQISMGLLSESAAAQSPMRNVITRAVGTGPSVVADVQVLTPRAGDIYLLCSDGLTRELPDAAIAVLLERGGTLDERNRSLVETALRAGGRDNVTCMLVAICQSTRAEE